MMKIDELKDEVSMVKAKLYEVISDIKDIQVVLDDYEEELWKEKEQERK